MLNDTVDGSVEDDNLAGIFKRLGPPHGFGLVNQDG
jgi:hypothetical protein